MLDRQGHVRLIDFGLAKQEISKQLRYTACGTPLYMTPEGVRNYRALLAAIPTERAPTLDASGAWQYNRPCAQEYVGKYQSCVVTSGRLIVHTPAGNAEQESEPRLRVGVEADWYTLGTLMFELFVGHAPFQAESQQLLLQRILQEPVPVRALQRGSRCVRT